MTVAVPETQHVGAIAVADRPLDDWIPVLREVVYLAEQIADSPFVPDGLRGSVPATAAAILAGRELGLGPMTSLANIHVIKGKPGLAALLMRALVLAQGHQWQDVDVSDARVVVRGRRKGESEWTEASFNRDQARTAGINLGGYPQDKLYARATVRLCRRKFADVIMGMPYSAEELEDGTDDEPQTDATPAAAPEQPKPRTAQRRTKTPAAQADPPAESAPAAGSSPEPAPQVSNLPPLPGEEEPDETDFDTPGTVTGPQLTKIAVLMGELGYAKDQRDDRLKLAARIVNRDLTSSKDLSKHEAGALIETIERCDTDYDKLSALLDAGDKPDE